jgi:hypothetical protein
MEFLIVSVAIVGFISALTVSRYMPADEALEQLGANVAVGVWIKVSLLLSTLVPILGILFGFTDILGSLCNSRGGKGSPLPGGAKNEDRAEVLFPGCQGKARFSIDYLREIDLFS